MKKLLAILLIALFTVAFTAPAFAAQTFSDVPAKHWAYDAVAKLAKAGLIEGYGDGTFRGDKPMNRYEFATLTVRAIDRFDRADEAQKKLIDQLSSEFAAELNRMGARMAKVEAKTNSWVVGGDTRFRFLSNDPQNDGAVKLHGSDATDYRVRLKVNGTINDNTVLQARIATNYGNKFGNSDSSYGSYGNFDIFNVTAKKALGMDAIRLGRTPLDFIGSGMLGKPLNVDGVTIYDTIGAAKFTGFTGNIKSDTAQGTGVGDSGNANQMTTAQLGFKLSKDFKFGLGYYWADVAGTSSAPFGSPAVTTPGFGSMLASTGSFTSSKGLDLSMNFNVGGLHFLSDYVASSLDKPIGMPSGSPKGWSVQVSNGDGPGATMAYYQTSFILVKPNEVGHSAFAIGYRSIDPGALPSGAGGFDTTCVAYVAPYSVFTHASDNQNSLYLVFQNVIDKNMLLSFEWQDIRVKNLGVLPAGFPRHLDTTFMTKLECFF